MTYRIIGNMTGNSMDAIDLVLTEFDGDKMTDIGVYSKAYTKTMQNQIESLRAKVVDKTRAEILALPDFWRIHDEYVHQIATCVNAMCARYRLQKKAIDAIGFHGKTLDHNPPSRAKKEQTEPYTLQIGSGQMLADLTGIKVIYDFRSAFVMLGFDGAPLVSPHIEHIAAVEGDACYYNGGNTSNFTCVVNGVAQVDADAGPCNEYVDNFIRKYTSDSYDVDGKYGRQGVLDKNLLQKLFDVGRAYYECGLPKSGDPQYYHKAQVFQMIQEQGVSMINAIRTLEYFAAYVAVHALTLIDSNIKLPSKVFLFGGGWKNPIVRESFDALMHGMGYVLPEHQGLFSKFFSRLDSHIHVKYSAFGEMMEARLFADLARYKLDNKPWNIPEVNHAGQKVVCGVIAEPVTVVKRGRYLDVVNLAAKGWQHE